MTPVRRPALQEKSLASLELVKHPEHRGLVLAAEDKVIWNVAPL